VVLWTLNRPDTRNTITELDMIDALEAAVLEANRDTTLRCAILTGAGASFSAGGNVKHMRDKVGTFAGSPAEIRQGYRHGIQRIPRTLYHCEVPVIAAVNGHALGAGMDLALMCDLRIASTGAVFAESFVRVGIVPGDGGAWLLPRVVGITRAAQLTYTGQTIDAETAQDWGIVSEIHPAADLISRAWDLANDIAANPPQVVRMTKRLLREASSQSLESHLELAAALQALAHHTHDHAEAVDALLDRRQPSFEGR
jgi:enoyl-CoA hydratase/carnithine racemase